MRCTLTATEEAALAKSLCFQFSDQAVNDDDLALQLNELGLGDPRPMRVYGCISSEVGSMIPEENRHCADDKNSFS